MNPFSPPIELSRVPLPASSSVRNRPRTVDVVREDRLPGGTKQRAILPFLRDLIADGFSEFVYASPFCGFAQVALAVAGKELEVATRVFCELDPGAGETPRLHDLSRIAESHGAHLVECRDLASAEIDAETFVAGKSDLFKLPLGFNHPRFLHHYALALQEQFRILCEIRGGVPHTLWLPVGSGTLARIFRDVIPAHVELRCVDVRVLGENDARIARIETMPNTRLYHSDLAFHTACRERPPVPSNVYYDAKVWEFLEEHAADGDVWWNVAR